MDKLFSVIFFMLLVFLVNWLMGCVTPPASDEPMENAVWVNDIGDAAEYKCSHVTHVGWMCEIIKEEK